MMRALQVIKAAPLFYFIFFGKCVAARATRHTLKKHN